MRVVALQRSIPDLPAEQQQPWWDWYAAMGVDPYRVPVPAVMAIDDDRRTITTLYRPVDEHGRVVWATHSEVVTIQLEAPALPLPAGYEVAHVEVAHG